MCLEYLLLIYIDVRRKKLENLESVYLFDMKDKFRDYSCESLKDFC